MLHAARARLRYGSCQAVAQAGVERGAVLRVRRLARVESVAQQVPGIVKAVAAERSRRVRAGFGSIQSLDEGDGANNPNSALSKVGAPGKLPQQDLKVIAQAAGLAAATGGAAVLPSSDREGAEELAHLQRACAAGRSVHAIGLVHEGL